MSEETHGTSSLNGGSASAPSVSNAFRYAGDDKLNAEAVRRHDHVLRATCYGHLLLQSRGAEYRRQYLVIFQTYWHRLRTKHKTADIHRSTIHTDVLFSGYTCCFSQ